MKRIYRCRHRDCKAEISALYHARNTNVTVSRAANEHTHQAPASWGLSSEAKEAINDLYRDGVRKPLQLYNILRSRGISTANKTQIDNFLKRKREKEHGPPSVTYHDISEWCEQRSAPPSDEHEVYVVKHLVDAALGRVCVVMSTKALQRVATGAKVVHTDATYKLTWQGFPAIVASVSDADRHVTPVAFAVSSGETKDDYEMVLRAMKQAIEAVSGEPFEPRVIVADAAEAITLAVEAVFPRALRRVCWFHVRKNVESYLRRQSAMKKACLEDISVLQLAQSEEEFSRASVAMLAKWERQWPESDFRKHFQKQWLEKNSSWYEGIDVESPSTNNGLEAFNNVIKSYTCRERLPVGQFLSTCDHMIKEWSLDTTDRRPFHEEPSVSTRHYRDAWMYMQEGKEPLYLDDGRTMFLPAGSKKGLTVEELSAYIQAMDSCESFEQYAEQRFAVWAVKAGENGQMATCSCPVGMKQRVCKHAITVGVWKGTITIPDVAKHAVIGQKRKRGRPTATRPALVRQD
ncbi:uncharacterized protein LOC122368178 isoform X2 [Amphibalanus amphitrite]|nr:uncharacterized protein LOC122368178 isoform X2 [Amphibalanus amphitrite]